jgi:putative membrane protein
MDTSFWRMPSSGQCIVPVPPARHGPGPSACRRAVPELTRWPRRAPACSPTGASRRPGRLLPCTLAHQHGQDVADDWFPADGIGQWEVRLDLVAVTAAVLLLDDGRSAMTEPAGPHATLPPASANGSAPPPRAAPRRRLKTRISGTRTALIAGAAVLIVVLIFIVQNAHAVNISFLGAHLRLSLAVALLLAAIAGALLMAAAGTARITQLRMIMRRDRRRQPPAPATPGR